MKAPTDLVRAPREAAFPAAEYDRRLQRTREAMQVHRVDCLLVQSTPNAAWLTGYETPHGNADIGVLVFPDRPSTVVVREDEVDLVPKQTWIGEVRAVHGADRSGFDSTVAEVLVAALRPSETVGLEFGRYPIRAQSHLTIQACLGGVTVVDASALVLDLRLVKSEREIAAMREAAALSSQAMRAAATQLRVGLTDNDIGRVAYTTMLSNGSEAPYPAPFIMTGVRTGWGPHLSWKRTPLRSGDPINIELTGVRSRYAAPLYRTGCIGQPSDDLRRVCDAVIECVTVVLESARPHEPAQDVARRATAKLDPIRSIVYCTGQVGYGVGLTLSPNWVEHSFRIIDGNPRPIVPGMTFHSPTAVRLPGKFAVCFSETWLMTDHGPEILTDMPLEMLKGDD